MDLKEYLHRIENKEWEPKAIDWIFSKFVKANKVNVFLNHELEIITALEEAMYDSEFDEHYGDIAKLLYGENVEGSFLKMILEDAGIELIKTETVQFKGIDEEDIDQQDMSDIDREEFESDKYCGVGIFNDLESCEIYKESFKEQNINYHEIENGVLRLEDIIYGYENLIYVDGPFEKLCALETAWQDVGGCTDILMCDKTVLMIIENEGSWDRWSIQDTVAAFLSHGLIEIPYIYKDNDKLVRAWNTISKIKSKTREVLL
jgi:hypothetical protein